MMSVRGMHLVHDSQPRFFFGLDWHSLFGCVLSFLMRTRRYMELLTGKFQSFKPSTLGLSSPFSAHVYGLQFPTCKFHNEFVPKCGENLGGETSAHFHSKCTKTHLLFHTAVIGTFAYWWIGWALAYGDGNAFMGHSQFGMKSKFTSPLDLGFSLSVLTLKLQIVEKL